MGTSYLQSKNLNNRGVIKLLALNDGRLSALFEDSIEIYSLNNLDVELVIEGGKNLKNLAQLSDGKLIISSFYSERDNLNHQINKVKSTKIISLENNSFSIVKTFQNDYFSEKILEKENFLFSFEQDVFSSGPTRGKSCINIFEKTNYTKTTKINNFITIGNNDYCWFIDACFVNNNEIMVVLFKGIKFLEIKDMNWTHEITNYYNYRQAFQASLGRQTSEDLICKLNDNLYLIGGDNKFYIIDVISHKIHSIINLEANNTIIKLIKKDLRNNIYVLMDNNYHHMKDRYIPYDYFCVYKYENNRLEKISEMKEKNKKISLFEKLNNNQIAFVMFLYDSFFGYDRSTYIKIIGL